MKLKQKTVPMSELSTIHMVAGGEEKHPTVIHKGILKDWVGIGWVDLRKATAADRKRYPVVKEGA